MLKGLFVLPEYSYQRIYGKMHDEIRALVDIYAPPQTPEDIAQNPAVLADAEVIFTGWGAPQMNEAFLSAAPKLKAVFYGAGTVKRMVTPAFWKRDIVLTSAAAANGVPVAEYTLSQILFTLKGGWYYARQTDREQRYREQKHNLFIGAYESTVGLISLGLIGQLVAKLLQPFDLNIIAYDPYADAELAKSLDVTLVTLEQVFEQAHVVSLHAPLIDATIGMITGDLLRRMQPNTTFINTARGAIVREEEMVAVLRERPDLYAILDVTYPEPPPPDSPLYTLPNVVLTPHIAGSTGPHECKRLGDYMLAELKRYLDGAPLQGQILEEKIAITA